MVETLADGMRGKQTDRFTVAVKIGFWGGNGWMEVQPGSIRLVAGPLLRRLVVRAEVLHTQPRVRFVRTRLMPPWLNTSVVLVGEDGQGGLASAPMWMRRRLRRSLTRAGFELVDVRPWFSLGSSYFHGN